MREQRYESKRTMNKRFSRTKSPRFLKSSPTLLSPVNRLHSLLHSIDTCSEGSDEVTLCGDVLEPAVIAPLSVPVVMPILATMNLNWSPLEVGFAPSLSAPSLQHLSLLYDPDVAPERSEVGTVECIRHFGMLDLTPAARRETEEYEPSEYGSDSFILSELGGGMADSLRCPKLRVFKMAAQDIYPSGTLLEELTMGFLQKRLEAAESGEAVYLEEVDIILYCPTEGDRMDFVEELENPKESGWGEVGPPGHRDEGWVMGTHLSQSGELYVVYKSGLAPLALLDRFGLLHRIFADTQEGFLAFDEHYDLIHTCVCDDAGRLETEVAQRQGSTTSRCEFVTHRTTTTTVGRREGDAVGTREYNYPTTPQTGLYSAKTKDSNRERPQARWSKARTEDGSFTGRTVNMSKHMEERDLVKDAPPLEGSRATFEGKPDFGGANEQLLTNNQQPTTIMFSTSSTVLPHDTSNVWLPGEGDSPRHILFSVDSAGRVSKLYDNLVSPVAVDPTPFTPHLDTNYCPSDQDMVDLEGIIECHQGEAKNLAEQILEAQKALSITIARHNALLQCIEGHSALLSPIRRLPEDVLETIFYTCNIDGIVPSSPTIDSSTHPVLTITRVCRLWRRLALESPRLWSSLNIEVPSPTYSKGAASNLWLRKMGGITSAFETWAARSSRCPLSVGLCIEGDHASRRTQEACLFAVGSGYGKLVRALQREASRWKLLLLVLIQSPAFLPLSLDLLQNVQLAEPPILEEVVVHVDRGTLQNDAAVGMAGSFHQLLVSSPVFGAPSLRQLALFGSWVHVSDADVIQRWKSLTGLGVRIDDIPAIGPALDATQVLTILHATPKLTKARIRLSRTGLQRPPTPVTLPSLLILSVEGHPPPIGFASSLSLPSLNELLFRVGGLNDGVAECIIAWGKTLTTLLFAHGLMPPNVVAAILEHLPNLERMNLEGTGRKGREVRLQDPSSGPGPDRTLLSELGGKNSRCPKLTDIRMTVQDVYPTGDGMEHSVLQFLLDRLGETQASPRSRLCNARFTFVYRKDGCLDVMQELQKTGLTCLEYT
ncbi:hypothetical protein NMY22_g11723 [Coprinellus aureogranulatus]|nr:hypothetical protein NMY22_g11723 [Coprinellus aureogranulatus]